jgi:hypothetical protein
VSVLSFSAPAKQALTHIYIVEHQALNSAGTHDCTVMHVASSQEKADEYIKSELGDAHEAAPWAVRDTDHPWHVIISKDKIDGSGKDSTEVVAVYDWKGNHLGLMLPSYRTVGQRTLLQRLLRRT